MFSLEFSIHIDASPEEVFRYITDIKRHPEWASNTMEMTVDSDPVQVGTTFSSVVNAFGKEKTTGKIVEMQAPSRFVYECDTSTSGLWRWTMTLTPEDGGTRLSHRGDGLKRPLYMRIMQPILFPLVGKKMATKGLANIKARVEGRQQVTPPAA